MMYLSVVTRAFRIDPSKGQVPRDPLAAERMTPQELIKAAKKKVKDRRPITNSKLEEIGEIFKMLMCKAFCCCRDTAF